MKKKSNDTDSEQNKKSSEDSDNSDSDETTSSGSESDESNKKDSSKEINDNIDPAKFFDVRELCHYKLIDNFFKKCKQENIDKMLDIINGKSDISLRILDWFVTKYSKKRIDCGVSKDSDMFDVRVSYKSQLKSYKKRYFDPFRRRRKFVYYFSNTKSINTTLGQLNFFKWAITNNIIEYVEKNLKQISKENNQSNREEKKKKKKRKEETVKKNSDKKPTRKKKTKTDKIKINPINIVDDGKSKTVLRFDD